MFTQGKDGLILGRQFCDSKDYLEKVKCVHFLLNFCTGKPVCQSAEVTLGNRGTLERCEPSYLLIKLLVHQQVRLGPASEEPHDVLPHLWAQQLCQARSGRPGLHL